MKYKISKKTINEMNSVFNSHKPKKGEIDRIFKIKDFIFYLEIIIRNNCKDSREKTRAIKKLDDVATLAISSIK